MDVYRDMSRRTLFPLATLLALAGCAPPGESTERMDDPPEGEIVGFATCDEVGDCERLRDVSAVPRVGTAITTQGFGGDDPYRSLAAAQFNSITVEDRMQWSILSPTRGQWNPGEAQAVMQFAEDNGMAIRGHSLVYQGALPGWVTEIRDPMELDTEVRAHVERMFNTFGSRIDNWDITNEVIADGATPAHSVTDVGPGWRDSVFNTVLGPRWHDQYYHLAREYAPNATLVYNDYNIATINNKSNFAYNMITSMLADDVPVDGIGFQMHISAADVASGVLTMDSLRENIRRFGALTTTRGRPFEVYITELDIRIVDLPGDDMQDKLDYQARVFQAIAHVCATEEACKGITTWGFTDRYSWVDSFFAGLLGRPGYDDHPLLLNEVYERKPAFSGYLRGLRGEAPDTLNFWESSAAEPPPLPPEPEPEPEPEPMCGNFRVEGTDRCQENPGSGPWMDCCPGVPPAEPTPDPRCGAPCDPGVCADGLYDCSSGSPVCVPMAFSREICRAATSECDVAERCDGTSAHCPGDSAAPAGQTCGGGMCNGAGACVASEPPPPTADPREITIELARSGDQIPIMSVRAGGEWGPLLTTPVGDHPEIHNREWHQLTFRLPEGVEAESIYVQVHNEGDLIVYGATRGGRSRQSSAAGTVRGHWNGTGCVLEPITGANPAILACGDRPNLTQPL